MVFYECGICGHLHPWDWDADCRDDANRYSMNWIEDNNPQAEIREWSERLEADSLYFNPIAIRAAFNYAYPGASDIE